MDENWEWFRFNNKTPPWAPIIEAASILNISLWGDNKKVLSFQFYFNIFLFLFFIFISLDPPKKKKKRSWMCFESSKSAWFFWGEKQKKELSFLVSFVWILFLRSSFSHLSLSNTSHIYENKIYKYRRKCARKWNFSKEDDRSMAIEEKK